MRGKTVKDPTHFWMKNEVARIEDLDRKLPLDNFKLLSALNGSSITIPCPTL
jgi:hypothetical protein